MKEYNTVFSSAEVLLPIFSENDEPMKKWAVIACDQFTSEPEYWKKCENIIGDSESTYNYIVPEAYLETPLEEKQSARVEESMKSFDDSKMRVVDGLIYLKRTLPNGEERHGLIGKIDLEAYDYSVGSKSAVRATEKTVTERIPPRCKIREAAVIELPHILILTDDKRKLYDLAQSLVTPASAVYDFDLIGDGGHVAGYALTGKALETMMDEIAVYERSHSGLTYAMGDGNHSLAAAKAHWENVKAETGDMSHPARYALCEITSISDESLVFEPIYRIMKNCDVNDVLDSLASVCGKDENQKITVITKNGFSEMGFEKKTHALTVGTLQNFIDEYIATHPGVTCDYIHGESSLVRLSMEEGAVGFLFDGMSKGELFPYIEEHGTLPRKTFSMGEARSKRYYIEARKIIK